MVMSPDEASLHQVSFRPDVVDTSGEDPAVSKTAAFRSTGGVNSSMPASDQATRIVSFDHGIAQDSKSSVCNVVYIAEESEESKLNDASGGSVVRPKAVDLSSYLSSGQGVSTFDKYMSSCTVGPAPVGRATS